jgi:hypothetical protein
MLKSYLLQGPLCSRIEARRALIEAMAKTLVENPEGLATENDAVRILRRERYDMIDVVMLAGEARMAGYQVIVAREMSEP